MEQQISTQDVFDVISDRKQRKYVNEECAAEIVSFVDANDVTLEEAVSAFLAECENFEQLFQDDTPISAVQRLAFEQMTHQL